MLRFTPIFRAGNGFNVFVSELNKKGKLKNTTIYNRFAVGGRHWRRLTPAQRAAYDRKAKQLPTSPKTLAFLQFRKANWASVSHLPPNKRAAAVGEMWKKAKKEGTVTWAKKSVKKASKAKKVKATKAKKVKGSKAAKKTKKVVKAKKGKKVAKKTVKKSK